MLRSLLLLTLFSLQSVFIFSQECGIIYVSPNGASSGTTGTKANPASLAYGLTLVSPANKKIRMAEGNYPITQPLQMQADLTIEGGFDVTTWIKSNVNITKILRDNSNIQTTPPALIGINCFNISNFRLMDLTLDIDDATGNGVTVYGIYISGCTEYTVSRCRVFAGNGSPGTPGNTGTTGMDGAGGTDGEPGQDVGNCCKQGGVGGSGSFPGSNAGGDAGNGADWGGFEVEEQCLFGWCQWLVTPLSEYTNPGHDGQNGSGYAPGQGGNGGVGLCELTYQNTNCLAQTINAGVPGTDGADGIEGFDGLQGTATFAGGYYVPGIGDQGNPGQSHGAGGGGGGGGGAKGCEPAALQPYIPTNGPAPYSGDTAYHNAGSGGGGGGGGEGGQAGGGGLGGSGGGGSFCVFVFNNGINGIVQDCYLIPGQGGQGGAGGSGGIGGQGGTGGQGGVLGDFGPNHSCNNGEGGDGGDGGQGGQGGAGGKGSDGMSRNFHEFGGSPVLRPYNYNPFEPEIRVEYYGCTNSTVIVETDTTGILNWIYGYGATPPGSEGNTDTVEYTGPLGFRNITLIVDGVPYFYANFIDITTDFTPPAIDASKTTLCAGQSTDLSASSTAMTYDWTIPGGSITSSSDQVPGTVTFDTPGDYIVELVTTSCCGTSKTTDTIHVLDAVVVDLGPDTAMCYLQDMPFLNAGGNPGANYSWTLNGTAITDQAQIVQAVGPGDYTVTVDYGGGCSGSDDINLDVFIVLPVDLGGDDAVCVNASFPVLDAGIANASVYAWTFNGNPIGQNTQLLQTILPGDYSVTITSQEGCSGADTMNLTVSDPHVNLGFDVVICSNEPYPMLNAGNPGADGYEWFYNNIHLSGDTAQTYQTLMAGNYSVIMTDQFGCEATDNMTVTVLPTINAQFTSPNTTQINNPVSFTDLSSPTPTTWNWNFGDGSPNVFIQSPVYTYTVVGTHPVFLIAANATCSDTAIHIIDVQYNCTSLGLVAGFTMNTDTVVLSGLGTVSLTDNSVNATQWFWDFGDGSMVGTSQNPIHAYTEPGIYTITQTAINYNCTTSVSQTIIVVEFGVGISQLSLVIGQLSIFPNPTSGIINVIFESEEPLALELELTNAVGQRVYINNPGTTKYFTEKLNLEGFSKGLYLFKVLAGDEVLVRKVVIE